MNTIAKPPTMVDEHTATAQAALIPAPASPMDMLRIAVERGASIEILNKLMDLQERVEVSHARKAFDTAIATAKAEIPSIPKNRPGHNGRNYADMAGIAKIIDPIIHKHGLSYRFRSQRIGNELIMTCILCHRAGHFEENSLPGPLDIGPGRNSMQAIGSSCTYLQRYTLTQALGLSFTDDDDDDDAESIGDIPSRLVKNNEPKIKPRDEYANFIREIFTLHGEAELLHHFSQYAELMDAWGDQSYYDAVEKFAARLSGSNKEFKALQEEASGFRSRLKLVAWMATLTVEGKPWQEILRRYLRVKLDKLKAKDRELALKADDKAHADQWVHDTDDADPRPATADDFDHEADEAAQAISDRAIAIRNGKR